MIEQVARLLFERWPFFAELALEHVAISFAAIAIAVVAGGAFGIFISQHERFAKPTIGTVNFLYTIPSISMLGFLIPFSGVGNVTAVIALTIYALLPMVRSTYTGVANVDPAIVEAARGMGSTRGQVLRRITIPLAMPHIMAGVRNMVTMTVALAGIASFIGAGGLGVAIYRGITTNNAAMTVAGSLLIALLALAADFVLGFVERRMRMRTARAKRTNRRLAIATAGACVAIVAVLGISALAPAPATLQVATKPMTEQYVLGNMLKYLIEQDTDLTVEITQGVGGGTSNIHPGMVSGEFDLYPEYTGTGWYAVLKNEERYSEDLFGDLQAQYNDELGIQWIGLYGFNNTYGLLVRREVAERYSLRTYSDLRRVAKDLTFGSEYDFFEREDGYRAVCDAYGFEFGNTMDLDIGLKYQALEEGRVDVIITFTTDGQLSEADGVVLEDDQGFFPSYRCCNVVRDEVIEEHPELRGVLEKLTGTISDVDMARMNYQVETEGREPEDVAFDFLIERGLLR